MIDYKKVIDLDTLIKKKTGLMGLHSSRLY